ncbi:hypothetical protein EG799_02610 [Aurantiacibacter spongiae]|uniref:Spermidine synthase n=1 Tax=Aurantiacibacter spongiae TaxID=2488860 RepID=A0A3N5CTV1_9SPHN|nr:hypothetical protein EG799_02610 [Aurantiacibacter spongiae]
MPPRLLYAVAIFAGSFLLFVVQPLIAREALPLLGGAPMVWNSAMLVFQLLLLGGYLYAHLLSRLAPRRQATIHLVLLALAAFTLPVGLADMPAAASGWQVIWVPLLFVASIGPVFLLLSSQSSLLQRWYANDPHGGNPYRLYAISNLGSFAGLAAYPLVIEPLLDLPAQSLIWSAGFVLVGLVLAWLALAQRQADDAPPPANGRPDDPLAKSRIWLWLTLSAVPSGLTLSTTTLLTTDLMAMPLLWVIPLGVYLLSFTVAFSDNGNWRGILGIYAPVLLLVIGGLAMVSGGQLNTIIAIAMVGLLFVLSVVLHGRLYLSRPVERRLTLFYLVVSIGGALGGAFVAILAPLLFDWVYEHVVLLLAAALLLPHRALIPPLARLWERRSAGRTVSAALVVLSAGLAWLLVRAVDRADAADILLLAVAIMAAGIVLIGKRYAYAATLAFLLLSLGGLSTLQSSLGGERSRSYFGVYGVQRIEENGATIQRLTHGTTMHGEQFTDPARADEPTAYYGPTSGVGIALAAASPRASVGVVGLGVGTLACYRRQGQDWTFFEIDPEVLRYSTEGPFTFLKDCAPRARVEIGDARVQLAQEGPATFDVLVLDAFSSDAIPLHLITREAFETYARTLAPDGLLLVHISNRFVDLAPAIAALAQAEGWHGMMRSDRPVDVAGITDSDWIALARSPASLRTVVRSGGLAWEGLPPASDRPLTDANASLLPLLRF